ncbi:MAG: archease [Candidatus Thermoplasmatota archaeon]|nr:archease [Candidatus Thermoplasmatota archaeon]
MRKNFEHTADIGIEVESANLSEAFEEISLSFSEIITGGNLPKSLISKKVKLESNNLDSLLVDFMSYLIVLFDTDFFITGSAELKISQPHDFLLEGNLMGEIYNQEIHGYGVEIKAISYHLLIVKAGPPAHIRVILDL